MRVSRAGAERESGRLHSWIISLILRDSESIHLHVGRDSLPSLSYKGHRLPSFQEPQIWGKAGSPKLEQTPGTFEQGGSTVNDLWIQGVSHLPRGAAAPSGVSGSPSPSVPLSLPPGGILEA